MSKPIIVYDDSYKASPEIKNIIGDKSFSEIIHKKNTLKEIYLDKVRGCIDDFYYYELDALERVDEFLEDLKKHEDDQIFIHIYSNFIIKNSDEFELLMAKHKYIKQNYYVKDERYALFMFASYEDYSRFINHCKQMGSNQMPPNNLEVTEIISKALYDISTVSRFIHFHSNSFESRFFNSVKGDAFTVVKRSTNKDKINREYTFYGLLPENMKHWFVMPYNYWEDQNSASYEMERLHMVDIATRWIHHAVNHEEFIKVLDQAFRFLGERARKSIPIDEYKGVEDNLYIKKVDERINSLKGLEFFDKIEGYINKGTSYSGIDAIVDDYKKLFERVSKEGKKNPQLVVGHGDLCFSNMLYNKEVDMLRLIDPKGALEEPQIWTNPHYDVAKLSHSICGLYDFINSGLFEIQLDEGLQLQLIMEENMAVYRTIFKGYLDERDISYEMIRTYEASLFLSMLPLHAENEKKVLGFILNAINIIEEVKECTKI